MSKVEEIKSMIDELLDYEAELFDSDLGFLEKVRGYDSFDDDTVSRVERIYDRVFEGDVKDTFEIWEDFI